MLQCYIRVLTRAYPFQEHYPEWNVALNQTYYIPLELVETPVPWTACAPGITNFKCESDNTNQTCAAPAGV